MLNIAAQNMGHLVSSGSATFLLPGVRGSEGRRLKARPRAAGPCRGAAVLAARNRRRLGDAPFLVPVQAARSGMVV